MELSFTLESAKGSILTQLLGSDQSAVQLADSLNLGESAIRNHLNTLEREGYVDHYFERVSKGRPKKMYTITSAGKRLFPRKYELIFTFVLRKIKEKYGEEALKDLISEVAADLAKRLEEGLPEEDSGTRLEKLVDSFEEWGLCPTLSKSNGEYHVKYRNCAFLEIVDEFAEYLCNMHREIISNAMPNCQVKQEECCGKGDNICIHRVILEKADSKD